MFGNWAAVHSWAAVSAALITPPPPPHPREFSSIPRGAQPLLHVCMYVSACERICCTSPSTCKTTGEVKVHLADAVKMLCHASLFTFFYLCARTALCSLSRASSRGAFCRSLLSISTVPASHSQVIYESGARRERFLGIRIRQVVFFP